MFKQLEPTTDRVKRFSQCFSIHFMPRPDKYTFLRLTFQHTHIHRYERPNLLNHHLGLSMPYHLPALNQPPPTNHPFHNFTIQTVNGNERSVLGSPFHCVYICTFTLLWKHSNIWFAPALSENYIRLEITIYSGTWCAHVSRAFKVPTRLWRSVW